MFCQCGISRSLVLSGLAFNALDMAAPSPRKFVPLAPGHDPSSSSKSIHSSTDISYTKRAFFAAVVVEEGLHGIGPGN